MQLWIATVPRTVVMMVAMICNTCLIVDHFSFIKRLFYSNPFFVHSFSLAQRKRTKRDIHPLQGLPLYGEDAIDFGPCPKSRFWYDSQSFRPYGVSHGDDDYASRWSGPSSSALKGTYCFGVTG